MGIFGNIVGVLRRMLSTGEDVAMAHAIANDNVKRQAGIISRWFSWGATDDDVSVVKGLATEATIAGNLLSGLDPQAGIDLSTIPTNPLLFGDNPEGRRIYIGSEFWIPGVENAFGLRMDFPDLRSTDQILEELEDEALKRIKDSPLGFGLTAAAALALDRSAISVAIKRF